jgi:hypothetical protein
MLLKIKLIGDVYMCAGGLFDLEKPPAIHAEQMIRSALDALRVIDEMNERLNAALAVRIGINSGGTIFHPCPRNGQTNIQYHWSPNQYRRSVTEYRRPGFNPNLKGNQRPHRRFRFRYKTSREGFP